MGKQPGMSPVLSALDASPSGQEQAHGDVCWAKNRVWPWASHACLRTTGEAEDTGIQPWPAAAEGQPSRDGQRGAEGGQSGTAPAAPRG